MLFVRSSLLLKYSHHMHRLVLRQVILHLLPNSSSGWFQYPQYPVKKSKYQFLIHSSVHSSGHYGPRSSRSSSADSFCKLKESSQSRFFRLEVSPSTKHFGCLQTFSNSTESLLKFYALSTCTEMVKLSQKNENICMIC